MSTDARALCAAALAGGLLLGLAAVPVRAQVDAAPEPPSDRAQRLFRQGVASLAEGRFEEARAVLEEALALEARASTAFNLASALHGLGRSLEAFALLERIASGELGELPEGFGEAHARLRDDVLARLARLEVSVLRPDVVTLRVDEEASGTLARGNALVRVLSPGVHTLHATSDGFVPERREVRLVAGQTERLALSLEAASLDAGSVDAGSLDAGSLDAGSLDAGSLDAGSLDAASIDPRAVAAAATPAPPPSDDTGLLVGALLGAGLAVAIGVVVLTIVLATQSEGLTCDPRVGCIET